MAQAGFTPIQLYYSSTTTNVPLAANLATGELAINITDGKLFYKDNTAAVQVIGWKVVPATAGGTGQTSYAVGDLLYADTTTTLAKLPDVATGNALISGGVSTAPSWGKIGLTTHVSGTLPTANGGTNLTSFTANGVMYASSTSALATGSGLVFDGANLGVGTTTLTSGGGWTPRLVLAAPGAAPAWIIKGGSSQELSIGASDSMYIDCSGSTTGTNNNIIFRNTATNSSFSVVEQARIDTSGNLTLSNGNLVIGTSGKGVTSGNFALGLGANGSTTAASIDTSGNLLVGATSVLGTSAAGSTHITGGANTNDQTPLYLRHAFATAGEYWKVGPTNNSGFVVFTPGNVGQYQTYGGVFWIATSDERKKDIIEPITDAVNKVSTLRAVIGKFKIDPVGKRRSFLLAQDVQAVLPEAVDATDPDNLGVSYSEVIPLLVAAIKELKAEFDSYKASH